MTKPQTGESRMNPAERRRLRWKTAVQKSIESTVGLRYAIDGLLYRQPGRTREAFAQLKNSSLGSPLLVVGNGPSLRQTPLDEFTHLPAIGMNKIDLIYDQTPWRPTLVVCVNNLVASQYAGTYQQTKIPVFLSWKCRWFMGRRRNPNVHYFKNKPTASFSRNVNEWVGSLAPTVTYTALQFAYFTSANPIILFGIDHKFDTNPGESGIEKSQGEDRNHFHPEYFRDGQYWGLPDLAGSERYYRLAREAFEEDGRQVLDATIGGRLEVFPKISIDEARTIAHS